MYKMFLPGNSTTDLMAEATAFLYYYGNRDQVRDDVIRHLMGVQLPNAGWSDNPDKTAVNDHTSVLSLWSLVEYLHPHAAKVHWLYP